MRCIKENVTQPPYSTAAWRLYTDGLSLSVFDIETTGLSPVRDALILGGVFNPGQPEALCQYLAESKNEEASVLDAFLEHLKASDVWISFNGDTFDIPFFAQRLRRHGIAQRLPLFQSVDLYRILRRYWPAAKLLPNLRQTSVEAALGLRENRRDEIDGAESVRLYTQYARTGEPALERKILLHNHDDLLMLHEITTLLSKLDLHKIMFQRGFLVKSENNKVVSDKITLGKNFLKLTGSTEGIDCDVDMFTDAYHFQHSREDKRFQLFIPCIYENNAVFIDFERFDAESDFSPLMSYAGFINGYLLLHDGSAPYYLEANHMIKIILKGILKKF